MTVEEQVRAGRLAEALGDLQSQIKKAPSDPRLRIFLFQLLAVMGQWDRALTQLEVAGELDSSALPMRQTYREVLRCEMLRRDVFAGRGAPLIFGEPAEWMALLVYAQRAYGEGKLEEAGRLRRRAFEDAPGTAGTIDDRPFEWIADADGRLGPMLEAVMNGKYYWVPFARLSEIQVEKPTDLRDIAWLPVTLTFTNGGQSVAFVPTRYPGSEDSADPRIVMARSTEWSQPADDSQIPLGLGQRLLATDQGEFPLMDLRVVKLGDPVGAPASSSLG
ncbi:MAG TPA: type VI secretion system accessory protein TagJ [Polyangia bacterium]|nr:type VI secretion system accessory protein TagJ [Polyangia bacterium]